MSSKVLLVEDNQRISAQLSLLLESMGLQVIAATTGIECLLLYNRELPQLIIIEQFLPLLSGEELILRMRRTLDPAQLPIIMLSSSRFGQIAPSLSTQINGVCQKPLHAQQFCEMVKHTLQQTQYTAQPSPISSLKDPEQFYLAWGDLLQTPLPSLLFQLKQRQPTGVLTLSLAQGDRRFSFYRGDLVYAESLIEDEQLIVFLHKRLGNAVDLSELERLTAGTGSRAVLQREAIMRAGLITEAELSPLYQVYIENVIIRSLFLTQSPYQFLDDNAYVRRSTFAPINLLVLLFEGVRSYYTPQKLLQALSPYHLYKCIISSTYAQQIVSLVSAFPNISFAPNRLEGHTVHQLLSNFTPTPQLSAQLLQTLSIANLILFQAPDGSVGQPIISETMEGPVRIEGALTPLGGRFESSPIAGGSIGHYTIPTSGASAQLAPNQSLNNANLYRTAAPSAAEAVANARAYPMQPPASYRPPTAAPGAAEAVANARAYPMQPPASYRPPTAAPGAAEAVANARAYPMQPPTSYRPPTAAPSAADAVANARAYPMQPPAGYRPPTAAPSAAEAVANARAHPMQPQTIHYTAPQNANNINDTDAQVMTISSTNPVSASPVSALSPTASHQVESSDPPISSSSKLSNEESPSLPALSTSSEFFASLPSSSDVLPSTNDSFLQQLEKDFLRVHLEDCFTILDISESSTSEQLQEAYHRFHCLYLPEQIPNSSSGETRLKAAEILRRISQAYGILSAPQRRQQFEEKRQQNLSQIKNRLIFAQEQFNLGENALEQQKFERAAKHYQKSLETNSKEPAYYLRLGWAISRQANITPVQRLLARSYIECALRMNPIFEDAYLYLGILHREDGKIEQAAVLFQRILLLNPGHKEANRLLQEIVNFKKR
jgi:CheY-like chemotaxis protein